ncbi:MAG: phytoene desaturase [Bacteriovoracia bacterium]
MSKKAAVIGSGFGGLSVAIRLQAAGFKTTIFEKRDLPGGRAYVFKQDGFSFDAGPTVITAPECIDELFNIAGKDQSKYVKMVPVMPFYRLLFDDGYKFDYSNDDEQLFSQIGAKNQRDVEGYKRFLKYSEEVFEQGYTNLVHVPFLNWWSMIRVAPQLMRLQSPRSVFSMVAKFIKDPHLRTAFSFHTLLVGGNPFTTSSIYTLIHFLERNWGVHFPIGGTSALVNALVKLFQDIGGTVKFNAEIDEITTANGAVTGVKLKDGTIEKFDAVVSNGEIMHTYKDLLRKEPKLDSTRRSLARKDYTMSLFLIYFGTDRNWDNLSHHNIIFGPRYKELLKDIFVNKKLADDFSLYLHNPTVTDPSLAPAGKHAYYVLAPVPNLGDCDVDWDQEAPKYADRILTYLESKYMPGLKKSIVSQRIVTPKYFEKDLNSHLGAAFSLTPNLLQSAFFRAHNRDDKIKGMYVAGAGTHPGAGVPGVINSGKATAGLVIEDFAGHLGKASGATHAGPAHTRRPVETGRSPEAMQ